jgi:hypothetical protein
MNMSKNRASAIYRLYGLSGKLLQSTLNDLEEYWKAKSIIYLDILGLPTLKGVAVTDWNDSIKHELKRFLNLEGWKAVVIRTDRKGGMGVHPPIGGYLVNLVDLDEQVQKFLAEDRIVMLLEPRDRYSNLYGINVMYDEKSPETLYLEVVGPGFDVSDINRGDLSPHERIWIRRRSNFRVTQRSITSLEEYKSSIERRLSKIGRLVTQNHGRAQKSEAEFRSLAEQFLEMNNYNLLLRHAGGYSPISIEYIERVSHFVNELPETMKQLGLETNLFVISATIFESTEELIFWDIVWPQRKLGNASHVRK